MSEVLPLATIAEQQIAAARAAATGRSAQRIYGGQGRALRQTVLGLAAGQALGEHENPGEATLHVVVGRVRLTAGTEAWEGSAGDFLVIPPVRHDLAAIDDAAVVLTVVKARR